MPLIRSASHAVLALFAAASIAALGGGCTSPPVEATGPAKKAPSSSPSATPSEWASPGAMTSLSFDDGAHLHPLSAVGWNLTFGADEAGWVSKPDAAADETVFVNTDGTCTAQYWQEVFEPADADDLSASDEFLASLSGATPDEMDEFAFDGHYALADGYSGERAEGDVTNRVLLWDADDGSYLLSARVFAGLDHEASEMANAYSLEVHCDPGVAPIDIVDSLDEIAKITVTERME